MRRTGSILAVALLLTGLLPSRGYGQEASTQPATAPSLPQPGDVLKVIEKATAPREGEANQWSAPVRLAVVFGVLAILPSMLVMATSFTRIVIVLAFIRRALTTQSIPPTIAIIGLALFLTLFTMSGTFTRINEQAIQPYLREEMAFDEAFGTATGQLKHFMVRHTRRDDLAMFVDLSGVQPPETLEDLPAYVVAPAFAISEFRTAFEMGCMLFIPFLLVDLVIAGILLSAGMMMLPPSMISLPFKIILFVLVDGWRLVANALVLSYG
ncbi:MAG TPA: flagellar type III secretion system pore protein FliP [Phycisphaerae bacterium]|nr:flagellar type III secretion system pore protein FliP [Phycisphaerae bacterium]